VLLAPEIAAMKIGVKLNLNDFADFNTEVEVGV